MCDKTVSSGRLLASLGIMAATGDKTSNSQFCHSRLKLSSSRTLSFLSTLWIVGVSAKAQGRAGRATASTSVDPFGVQLIPGRMCLSFFRSSSQKIREVLYICRVIHAQNKKVCTHNVKTRSGPPAGTSDIRRGCVDRTPLQLVCESRSFISSVTT